MLGAPVYEAGPIFTAPMSSYEDQISSQEMLETAVKEIHWPNEKDYTSISNIERMGSTPTKGAL